MKSYPLPRRASTIKRHLSVLIPVLVIAGALTLPFFATAQNETVPPPANARKVKPESVPNELLVRFRSGSELARNKGSRSFSVNLRNKGAVPAEAIHFGGSDLVEGLMLVRVSSEDTAPVAQALMARPDVIYAEPNYIRRPNAVSNDPSLPELYALHDNFPGISAMAAWNTTQGSSSVVVGVIDSGIDILHADLKDNIFANPVETPNNGVDDDNNGFIDDVNGWDFVANDRTVFDSANDDAHGTHVAGTIGAKGNNAIGVVGVNWNVKLLPLKAITPDGGTDADLLEAYQYAKLMKDRGVNLRVLNNSYSGQGFSQSLFNGIKQLNDSGILFVAAAGNETTNNDAIQQFPGGFDLPNIIAVAASDKFGDFFTPGSNRGPQSVHIAAPGDSILSTTPRGYTGPGLIAGKTEGDGSTYSIFHGTSMATPHVAGAAALACAVNSNITLEKLKAAVTFNGDPNGALINRVITESKVSANKTVQAALENDTTAPAAASNFRIDSQNGRRIGLKWNDAGDDGTVGRASMDEIRFTDSVSSQQFRLNFTRPVDPGTERIVFVSIPIKHSTGQLSLRTTDNVGNVSVSTVDVTIANDVADPYTVGLSAPAPLTSRNSGQPLGVKGDDIIGTQVQLQFPFQFFGFTTTSVNVGSNGALYIQTPPDFSLPTPANGGGDMAIPFGSNLEGLSMIAGMWSDIRTDRNATDDVYLVKPDRDRAIFRWQGVKFGLETPINFEIELRRDGSIQTRYGEGNQNLLPVVAGISSGDPEAYLVPSHTSETSPLSLSQAQTVTFALRNPPPTPVADLAVSVSATPTPVTTGGNITYVVRVVNHGPFNAEDIVMTDPLPAGTTFVSCTTSHTLFGSCTGPAVGANGTVTGQLLELGSFDSSVTFTIVAKVNAAPGASIVNTASATSFRSDPNPNNNSGSATSSVVTETFFGNVSKIAAGNAHTTVRRNDGTVWNWGRGGNGQLGNGTSGILVSSSTPVQVAGLTDVIDVADGNGWALALKSDGTVWGWGTNVNGQLGDGTQQERSLPVRVTGLTDVRAIETGDFYSVALKNDGTVWLWGSVGGLAIPLFITVPTPMQLNGIADVKAISGGGNHLLMLKNDKTVWGVGPNSRGELGDGTTTPTITPVQVSGLSGVKQIAAGGDEFSLALKEDGTVWGWGINFAGQLGPGGGPMNFDAHPLPIQTTGLPAGITNIAVGRDHCLSIAADGTVWSWGNNGNAQLGQGISISQNPTPAQIPNFSGVVAIAGGRTHSIALKTDGFLWGWGSNAEGELGDGLTSNQRMAPARVSGLETVSSPIINPASGSFNFAIDVMITSATAGATIHYTTNSLEPTENDPMVPPDGKVRVSTSMFLRAKAWKPGLVPSSISFANIDIGTPANQIDISSFFVRRHYLDFLGREPDTSGLNFWTNNIEGCNVDLACREVKRTDTSAAFFLSIEFQSIGYLVYRTHKVAFGNLPSKPVPVTFQVFIPEVAQLGQGVIVGEGDWQTQIENNKRAYADQFVLRSEFVTAYPNTMTAAQYVDALNTNTGGALTQAERDGLVADLTAATKTRAQVLRAVAENPEVSRREFNRAFVLMQYFGYLRRNPDNAPDSNFDGYNFWLNKLNQFNGDFRKADMVKAFIVSGEYRHRFGP